MNNTCKQCGKEFFVKEFRRAVAKYCSRKCQHNSMRGIPNLILSKKITKQCVICDEIFKVSSSHNHLKCCSMECQGKWRSKNYSGENAYWYKKPRTHKTKTKISKALKGKHTSPATEFKKGEHNSPETEFRKGHIAGHSFTTEKLKKLWSNPEYKNKTIKAMCKGRNNKINKKEQKLYTILYLLFGNKYRYNKTTVIYGLVPDFIDDKNKKIIELYGDYWHNLPKTKKRDKNRIGIYSLQNYRTLIIWEHELKNESELIKKILEFNNVI